MYKTIMYECHNRSKYSLQPEAHTVLGTISEVAVYLKLKKKVSINNTMNIKARDIGTGAK